MVGILQVKFQLINSNSDSQLKQPLGSTWRSGSGRFFITKSEAGVGSAAHNRVSVLIAILMNGNNQASFSFRIISFFLRAAMRGVRSGCKTQEMTEITTTLTETPNTFSLCEGLSKPVNRRPSSLSRAANSRTPALWRRNGPRWQYCEILSGDCRNLSLED